MSSSACGAVEESKGCNKCINFANCAARNATYEKPLLYTTKSYEGAKALSSLSKAMQNMSATRDLCALRSRAVNLQSIGVPEGKCDSPVFELFFAMRLMQSVKARGDDSQGEPAFALRKPCQPSEFEFRLIEGSVGSARSLGLDHSLLGAGCC